MVVCVIERGLREGGREGGRERKQMRKRPTEDVVEMMQICETKARPLLS